MDTKREHLAKLNIDPDSKLGSMLLALDKVYANIESKQRKIRSVKKEIEQLKEDADLMETAIMYYINREQRNNNGI